MKTKHTTGPWEAVIYDGAFDQPLIKSGHVVIGRVYGMEYRQQEANAKLIAAAPDLLEACMMAMQDTIMLLDETAEFTPENLKSTIEVLSNAIKKAIE